MSTCEHIENLEVAKNRRLHNLTATNGILKLNLRDLTKELTAIKSVLTFNRTINAQLEKMNARLLQKQEDTNTRIDTMYRSVRAKLLVQYKARLKAAVSKSRMVTKRLEESLRLCRDRNVQLTKSNVALSNKVHDLETEARLFRESIKIPTPPQFIPMEDELCLCPWSTWLTYELPPKKN